MTGTDGAPIGDALAAAVGAFEAAGIETPRLDAEVLLSGISGLDRAALIADPGAKLPPADSRAFSEAVRRRLSREPVAYILGRKGFRRIELAVDGRALIPRPETEQLVELAVERNPSTLLEVGVGSGAVSLAVADELPGCRITATDTSVEALKLAAENAGRLGLSDRVELLEGTVPAGEFDLILANLPYVADRERLAPEIAEWEPRSAVFAGPTGYEAFESVLGQISGTALRADAIGLEVGFGQGDRVAGLVREAGFPRVAIRDDLAGIGRVVVGLAQRAVGSPDPPG
ncbi:MAG: peptide chain release factor N(5)-glutamine methyltransferase [Solirubrobacterales bacterium]|nr:peptide chain release factor N(5)-glutamine methyltransferase [Solirubrobacterales bacterium]